MLANQFKTKSNIMHTNTSFVTVVFTGNREQKLQNLEKTRTQQALAQTINRATNRAVELGYDKIVYISGVAPGVDTWAAQLVLQQAQQRHDLQVELVAAVPTKTFPSVWPNAHRHDFGDIVGSAHQVHYVSGEPYQNAQQLHQRNEFMIDQMQGPDDLVLAFHNGSRGGTQKCIDYAIGQQKAIALYNPKTNTFTRLGCWPQEQKQSAVPKTGK